MHTTPVLAERHKCTMHVELMTAVCDDSSEHETIILAALQSYT